MKISRHVKNNMRLYGFSEADIGLTISSPDKSGQEDEKWIALKLFEGRFGGYPLKVVYKYDDDIFVITAYPLKKAFGR